MQQWTWRGVGIYLVLGFIYQLIAYHSLNAFTGGFWVHVLLWWMFIVIHFFWNVVLLAFVVMVIVWLVSLVVPSVATFILNAGKYVAYMVGRK